MERDIYKWQFVKDGEMIIEDAFLHEHSGIAYQEAKEDCKARLEIEGIDETEGKFQFTDELVSDVYKWEYIKDGEVILSDLVLYQYEGWAESEARADCESMLHANNIEDTGEFQLQKL